MEANKSLELARKAYPNDENLRVAYMLGIQKGAENLEEKLSKAVKLADAMYYAAQMLSTDASHLKKAMEDWWQFKNVELCESEDERIRKELIAHCRNTRCVTEEGAEQVKNWIAWLEKQGKKNSVTTKEEEKVREQVVYAINKLNVPESEKNKLLAWLEKQDPKKHEEELEKAYKTADKVQYRRGYEAAMKEMEKQGEQKSDCSNKEKLMLDDIIEATERSNIFMEDYQRELVDWLKSLEQRIGGEP